MKKITNGMIAEMTPEEEKIYSEWKKSIPPEFSGGGCKI